MIEFKNDDAEPLSLEWLLAAGGVEDQEEIKFRSSKGWWFGATMMQECADSPIVFSDWGIENNYEMVDQTTRGQFRATCVALGITLKPEDIVKPPRFAGALNDSLGRPRIQAEVAGGSVYEVRAVAASGEFGPFASLTLRGVHGKHVELCEPQCSMTLERLTFGDFRSRDLRRLLRGKTDWWCDDKNDVEYEHLDSAIRAEMRAALAKAQADSRHAAALVALSQAFNAARPF